MPPGHSTRLPIAGQLSEAELQLSEEVEEIATAPKFVPDVMVGPMAGMAILKEDLKFRSLRNKELMERQKLAFQTSARKHLADQVSKSDKEADEAKWGISEISRMVQDGMPQKEAETAFFTKNPHYALNATLVSGLKVFGEMVEEPFEKFMRVHSEGIVKMGLLNKEFDAKFALAENEVKYEQLDAFRENLFKGIEAEKIRGDKEVISARIDLLKTELEWNASQNFLTAYNGVRQGMGMESVDEGMLLDVQHMMFENGLEFTDFQTFIERQNPSKHEVAFLGDKGSINELAAHEAGPLASPEEVIRKRNEMIQTLSVLDDPSVWVLASSDGFGNAESSKKIAAAQRLLKRGGMIYRSRHRARIEQKKTEDELRQRNDRLIKPYRYALSEIREDLTSDRAEERNPIRARMVATNMIDQASRDMLVLKPQDFSLEDKIASILRLDPKWTFPPHLKRKGRKFSIEPVLKESEKTGNNVTDQAMIRRKREETVDAITAKGSELGIWMSSKGAPEKEETESSEDYANRLIRWMDNALRYWSVPRTPGEGRLKFEYGTGAQKPASERDVSPDVDEDEEGVISPDVSGYLPPRVPKIGQ